jgi:hypothetical protein
MEQSKIKEEYHEERHQEVVALPINFIKENCINGFIKS